TCLIAVTMKQGLQDEPALHVGKRLSHQHTRRLIGRFRPRRSWISRQMTDDMFDQALVTGGHDDDPRVDWLLAKYEQAILCVDQDDSRLSDEQERRISLGQPEGRRVFREDFIIEQGLELG